MANLSHMSIAQAEALGTEKVQTLIRNQANNTLNSMSIGKAEALGADKVNDLLNLSQTGINSSKSEDDEEEKIINNTITAQDSLVRRYGIRQEIVIKNNKEDPNIKARRILSDNCKPKEEIEVECIGDLNYRVGFGVHLNLPFLQGYEDCFMYIKSVEHEWKPNGMFISKLTLTPSRVMDEKDWSDVKEDDEDSDSSSGSDLWTKIYPLLKQQIGKPYVYTTCGPDSFDCSGLVYYVYSQFNSEIGFNIGRDTYSQIKQGKEIDSSNMDEWEPGDLVFPKDSHVVVYTGDKKCIEAMQTGTNVMEHEYNRVKTYAVRRVLPEGSSGSSDMDIGDIPSDYYNAKKAVVESNVSEFLKNMKIYDYKTKIISVAKKYSLDPYLIAGIIAAESGGDPSCTSSAGANGLMQVIGGSMDILQNLNDGCKVYKDMEKAISNTRPFVVLTSYGIGNGNLGKVVKKWSLNLETVSMKELWDAIRNSSDILGSALAKEGQYGACKQIIAMQMLKSQKALD